MNKKEFIALFAKNAELKTKTEAEKLIGAFLQSLEESLVSGDGVTFMGFGKFETVERKERTCVNPQTKKKMKVAAKKVVRFKAGKTLADKVNVVEKKAAKKTAKKAK